MLMQAAAVLLQIGAMEVLQTQKHSPRDHHMMRQYQRQPQKLTQKCLTVDASNLEIELTLCAHARCSGSGPCSVYYVGLSELSELSELSDCRTHCRNCRTLADTSRASSHCLMLSDAVGTVGRCRTLSDCRTVGCVGLSDTVGPRCRTVGPGLKSLHRAYIEA